MRGESKRRRRVLRLVAAPVLLCAAAIGGMQADVLLRFGDHVFALDEAPSRDVAIVLGASVQRDGTPSNMLDDRLRAAAKLWHEGRVRRVLVSGDRSVEREYDEVGAMARALEAAGVPADAIVEDPAGRRTFDSMWRAKHEYGIDDALVVTNPFHVSRAVWLGRELGLDVDGVAAPAGHDYSATTRFTHELREFGARVLAWLDVRVLDTRPGVGHS